MASSRKSFPSISPMAWWKLRDQFVRSLPAQVTASYLATVLGMKEQSAKANVLPGLRAVGLIDKEGAPTPRATEWRDDAGYSEVCHQIRSEIYPRELLDAVTDPVNDRDVAAGWFMRTTGCGQNAAKKMATLYSLLAAADPTGGKKPKVAKPRKRTQSRSKTQPTIPDTSSRPKHTERRQGSEVDISQLGMPEMRLNLEIRIDASVTPEQIDLIFASMAKHLYRRDDEGR